MSRKSTLDSDYITGELSNFSPNPRTASTDPKIVDSKDTLYEVANNGETKLKANLSYNGKLIVVEDTSSFPDKGLIRVGAAAGDSGPAELIYYGAKTKGTFKSLVRGFAGSRQNQWSVDSWVTNAVTAEPHNAVKDAILNIEEKTGVKNNPVATSLNGRVNSLEQRFLAPKASFKGFPKEGKPNVQVSFHDFSEGDIVRYLWDFGDGTQSTERNPIHTYLAEGIYTVKVSIITSSGGQGLAEKLNYIKVSDDNLEAFFYVLPQSTGVSIKTAQERTDSGTPTSPTKYRFVDQTDGDVKQRFWIFGDGSENLVTDDPNVHEVDYEYPEPGSYDPSVLVAFADDSLKRIYLQKKVTVE